MGHLHILTYQYSLSKSRIKSSIILYKKISLIINVIFRQSSMGYSVNYKTVLSNEFKSCWAFPKFKKLGFFPPKYCKIWKL